VSDPSDQPHATEEEAAAIMAVLAARAARPAEHRPAEPGPEQGWAAHWRGLRGQLRPGPDAWRFSGRRG
jgi:hypothetical protein